MPLARPLRLNCSRLGAALVLAASSVAAHAASGGAVPYAARALRPLLLLERLRTVRNATT